MRGAAGPVLGPRSPFFDTERNRVETLRGCRCECAHRSGTRLGRFSGRRALRFAVLCGRTLSGSSRTARRPRRPAGSRRVRRCSRCRGACRGGVPAVPRGRIRLRGMRHPCELPRSPEPPGSPQRTVRGRKVVLRQGFRRCALHHLGRGLDRERPVEQDRCGSAGARAAFLRSGAAKAGAHCRDLRRGCR